MVNKTSLEQDKWVAKFKTLGCLSDHAPSIISLLQEERHVKKPFKFYNIWTLHEKLPKSSYTRMAEG